MNLLDSIRHGRGAMIALSIAGVMVLGFVGYQVRSFFSTDPTERDINRIWLICTETRKPYQVDLANVREIPAYSPFSHKKTGVRTELCYWTADGKPRKDPTPVLLNAMVGDPAPTFCPDCGRLVVARNPRAEAGAAPPPTREEYERRAEGR